MKRRALFAGVAALFVAPAAIIKSVAAKPKYRVVGRNHRNEEIMRLALEYRSTGCAELVSNSNALLAHLKIYRKPSPYWKSAIDG